MNPDPQLTQESIRAVDPHPAPAPQPSDLDAPELYVNRELSWVEFDDRVMQLAEDPAQPLLERCKFAAIFESNLDEFFMIRVAGLHDQVDAGITAPKLDGRTPSETIDAIRAKVLDLNHTEPDIDFPDYVHLTRPAALSWSTLLGQDLHAELGWGTSGSTSTGSTNSGSTNSGSTGG